MMIQTQEDKTKTKKTHLAFRDRKTKKIVFTDPNVLTDEQIQIIKSFGVSASNFFYPELIKI